MGLKYTQNLGILGGTIGFGVGFAVGIATGPVGWLALAGAALAAGGTGVATGGFAGTVFGYTTDKARTISRARTVQILGPKQGGKNSVYDTIIGKNNEPDPTNIGTKSLYKNVKNKDAKNSKLKLLANTEDDSDLFQNIYELSGEDFTAWREVIKQTNPHGIIYVTDSFSRHGTSEAEKRRLAEEIAGLKIIENALKEVSPRNIKAFMILMNKIDMIANSESILEDFRKALLQERIDGKTTETHLREVLSSDVPIRFHRFCSHWEKRSNYLTINQAAIKVFNDDLHR